MPAANNYEELSTAVAKMITYVACNFLSVPADIEKAFRFASLEAYSFRQRVAIRAISSALHLVFMVIGKTLRYEIEGEENLRMIGAGGCQPIYCFWHDRIFAGTYYFRGRQIIVMNSLSFDGAYMARFVQKLGYGSVRGSSTRGGTGALVEMIRLMRAGYATAFTVDGPRGPRYDAKLGPVLLAKKTGDPLLPFLLECRSFWTISSWDKAQIPKPFTKVKLMIDRPISVSSDATDDELETARLDLEQALNQLVERGKRWRDRSGS
jgi:lysophospholipid acyltransferase (LPLAT)-like uncharacterized protein